MAVTMERFAEGLTYEEYKTQMTRNRERFEENERTVELAPSDIAFFQRLEQPANVLVIAEDWCGDVINNLPVLGRLAATSEKLNVRVFLRDQNLDIMDQYLKNGEFRSIPVFVVFDEQFKEVGHFIERPESVTQRMQQFHVNLFATDPILSKYSPTTSPSELPEDIRQHYSSARSRFREEIRMFADQEVIREVRDLFSRATKASVDAQTLVGESPSLPPAARPGAPRRAPDVSVDAPLVTVDPASPRPDLQPTLRRAVDVRITYCAECGYEPQTLSLTGDLMREFVHGLGSITLIPWQDGAFDVVVDGELVHSMYRDGGFPQSETIVAAVRSRLQA